MKNAYPNSLTVDFTSLKAPALRKYIAYHKLNINMNQSQTELAIEVAKHFNATLCGDEDETITTFISYIHDGKTPLNKVNEIKKAGRKRKPHLIKDGTKRRNKETSYNKGSKPEHYRSEADKSEQRYCICKKSSYGNMIACDNKRCPDRSNWYHWGCVGLNSDASLPDIWYCPRCAKCQSLTETNYRKPSSSITYGDMISYALTNMVAGKGSFKEICDVIEKKYESQLNWKLESDLRKTPVWKSSVRKILFSNVRFKRDSQDKNIFCMA